VRSRNPSVQPVLALLAVLGLMLLAREPGGRLLWMVLMDSTAAAWVQAVAGVVQAVVAVVLIALTVATVNASRQAAKAAEASAEATRATVEESIKAREQAREQHTATLEESARQRDQAREQHAAAMAESERQRDQIREQFRLEPAPVLTLSLQPPPKERLGWRAFDIDVRNVGRGPALDVQFRSPGSVSRYVIQQRPPLTDSGSRFAYERGIDLLGPIVLAPGDSVRLRYETAGPDDQAILERAVETRDFGLVEALYRDVFGDQLRSTVRIVPNIFDMPVFGTQIDGLTLGPLAYQRISPDQTQGTENAPAG